MKIQIYRLLTVFQLKKNMYTYIETDSKKMRLGFSKFVTILLTIMLISIHILNNQTLRIPKW